MIVIKRITCDHEPSELTAICYRIMVLTIFLLLACTLAAAQQVKQFVDEGLAAFDRGDTTAARDSFEKALSLKQDEVTAHTYLGIIPRIIGYDCKIISC